jgi:feruloyl-CoA synthase
VVCGEAREAVGLLLYPNPALRRAEVEAAARAGLASYNATAHRGGRVARALVLPAGPDAGAGEITDKGYIAQPLARALHADTIARLFADPPHPDVMVFPA